jgi:hypothetical protein
LISDAAMRRLLRELDLQTSQLSHAAGEPPKTAVQRTVSQD